MQSQLSFVRQGRARGNPPGGYYPAPQGESSICDSVGFWCQTHELSIRLSPPRWSPPESLSDSDGSLAEARRPPSSSAPPCDGQSPRPRIDMDEHEPRADNDFSSSATWLWRVRVGLEWGGVSCVGLGWMGWSRMGWGRIGGGGLGGVGIEEGWGRRWGLWKGRGWSALSSPCLAAEPLRLAA